MTTITQPGTAQQQQARWRGLPIAGATLRENKTAIYSIIAYILFLMSLIAAIGPGFKLEAMNSFMQTDTTRALFGLSRLPQFEGFVLFLGVQAYGTFSALVFGGSVAFFVGSTIARNIDNGMIELTLSRPISRTRYYLERWLGGIAMLLIFTLVTLGSIGVASMLVEARGLNLRWLLAAQLLLSAIWFAFAGLGMLTSVCFSSGRAGGGAALGLVIFFYLLHTLGSASKSMTFLSTISPFKYIPMSEALLFGSLTWWHPVLLMVLGLAGGLAGLVVFRRRDIAV